MKLITNLKYAYKYAKDQLLGLIIYLICNIFIIIISVVLPILSAKVIVDLTANKLYQVILVTLILFLVESCRNFISYLTRNISSKIYRETFSKIQIALGKEILKLENKCLDSNSSGVFIQRLMNDTSKIADVFNVLNIYLTHILTDIGIFGAVFIINKKAFLFLVIMILTIYIVEQKRVTIVNEKDKAFRKHTEKISGFVGELVRGARDIKMLSAEKSFMLELEDKLISANNERYRMVKTNSKYSMMREFLVDIFDTLMILLLVYLIFINELTIAAALVIHNYMGRVSSIVNYFSLLLEKIKDFNLSSERLFAIIDGADFSKETFGDKHLAKVKGNFEFKDVAFSYNDKKKVLNKLNFKVKTHETIGIVGKSGAGKTTIFNLLCKMYDVDEGVITIDGVNINELDKESIRDNITIISQSPYIFNLSIKDNLRLVKSDLTSEEMREACKLACLADFVESLPDKYDTIVGEGGISLSGGERQRLAIARALVQKTEIILFDEATSALDNETQAKIQQAIENLKKDYTILIIAHRLSTLVNCDRILFLNNGKIEAEGTHEKLLKTNKNYRQLYEAEIKK